MANNESRMSLPALGAHRPNVLRDTHVRARKGEAIPKLKGDYSSRNTLFARAKLLCLQCWTLPSGFLPEHMFCFVV